MPKPRGRNARNTANVVGRGSGGYSTGEKYVMPKATPLQCPGCSKCIGYDKPTNTFICGRCEGRFTPGQVKASMDARYVIEETARQKAERKRFEEKMARMDDEDRVRRALINEGNTSIIYYIRFRDTVKVGTSIDVAKRLTMHPWEELVAIEPGGRTLEQKRHNQLRAARLDGEWFELTDHVRDFIADINRANAIWYGTVFACAGPLPVAKKGARFPALADYPPIG